MEYKDRLSKLLVLNILWHFYEHKIMLLRVNGKFKVSLFLNLEMCHSLWDKVKKKGCHIN